MRTFKGVMVAVLSFVGFCAGLVGCKPDQKIAARLAVSYATAKYIERANPSAQPERARRIRAVVEQVEKASTGESVTIAALRAYIVEKLPADLSPADKFLAGQLIDVATEELQARVGIGAIPPDKLVKVREVLGWVLEATYAYAPETGPE